MVVFPSLSTGAVCQYPTQIVHQQAVQVLRYIDGQDQRFLRQGRQFRRWEIKLEALTEKEVIALEAFFRNQLGDYLAFEFYDPFSRTIIPNCIVGNAEFVSEFLDTGNCAASLWVVETNG